MAVILAKYAGFCFGVQRAVSTVYDIIEKEKNSNIYTLGKIIHNPIVTEELEAKGVKIISDENIDSVAASANEDAPAVVVIRTHGVVKELSDKLLTLEKNNPFFHVVD